MADPLLLMLEKLVGETDVKPVDISKELPRHPKKRYKTRALSSVKRVILHTTDMNVSILQLANYDIGPNHISKTGCPAITYSDVVMPNGTIFHTLPYQEIAWHVGKHNDDTIGIAMMYLVTDPKTKKDTYAPSSTQLKATYVALGRACLQLNISPVNIFGHRELETTGWFWEKGHKRLRKTCPGLSVDMDKVRYNVAKYMQIVLTLAKLYDGAIDCSFGPKSLVALSKYKEKCTEDI